MTPISRRVGIDFDPREEREPFHQNEPKLMVIISITFICAQTPSNHDDDDHHHHHHQHHHHDDDEDDDDDDDDEDDDGDDDDDDSLTD